jgi:steroid delta-isomerase-like uncharacterized protein
MAPQKDHAALARLIYDSFNTPEFDKTVSMIADNLEWRNIPFNETYQGKNGYREYFQNWLDAFPDGKPEITKVINAGNIVVVEFIGRGTHKGAHKSQMGEIPPTNRRAEIPFCDILEFRDGMLVKARSYFDAATMMRQLGLDRMRAAA